MNFSKKLIYMCATVLTALLSVGCTQSDDKDDPDDPGFEEGIPTEVRITLSARSGNGTRSFGEAKDPNSSVELIHDWWLAFISTKTGDVKVITRNQVTDNTSSIPSTVTDPKNGFEAETFKIILPSGNYRIYAFANIQSKPKSFFDDKLKIEQGKYKLKNIHISDIVSTSFIDGMRWPDDQNIPMTAVMERLIKNTVEEAFSIEVVRAVAKVEFAFSNSSTEEISLKTLQISPISNDPSKISIVPNYGAVGNKANEKLITDNVTTGTLSFNFDTPMAVKPNYTLGFYCNESLPYDKVKYQENYSYYSENDDRLKELYPKPFQIDLTVDKNGTIQNRTFYTTKITYINRNDWIFIPIEFSDWKIYWKLRTYPPIGGYPPLFDQNEDGSSLKATVTTGGEFELYPSKIMKGTQDFTSYVDWTKDVTLTVLEGNDIFITAPKLEPDPNNSDAKIIVGELDPKKTGTARVQIDFNLDSTTTGITDVLTCIFTIIRQNSAP